MSFNLREFKIDLRTICGDQSSNLRKGLALPLDHGQRQAQLVSGGVGKGRQPVMETEQEQDRGVDAVRDAGIAPSTRVMVLPTHEGPLRHHGDRHRPATARRGNHGPAWRAAQRRSVWVVAPEMAHAGYCTGFGPDAHGLGLQAFRCRAGHRGDRADRERTPCKASVDKSDHQPNSDVSRDSLPAFRSYDLRRV